MITLRSEPTTAKGIMSCEGFRVSLWCIFRGRRSDYPDRLVQLSLLLVSLFRIERIHLQPMELQFLPNL